MVVAGAVALGAASVERLGEREPSAPVPGTATSATWLCPHGGGKAYEGAVYLANPGEAEVRARVSGLSVDGPSSSSDVVVPAGSQVEVEVDATDRSSSTFVETFGGWLAAGWLVRAAQGQVGIGVEPCAAEPGRAWVNAGAGTGEGDDAFLVVMNPYGADAVFDVALFSAERAPVRDSDLTDLTLRPRRSTAIRLNEFAQGEEGLGVSIEVSSGRVAASTMVVSEGGGIGSVLASAAPGDRHLLLTSTGAGQSVLTVSVPTVITDPGAEPLPPGQLGSTFAATLRSEAPPQPAGGLSEQAQEPESAAAYPISTNGPSAVDLVVREGAPVVVALRTTGVGNDGGATAGSAEPATSWVVTPTVAGDPARPGLLVLNPGQSQATVSITSIPSQGEVPAATTITVAPGSVAGVPRTFLDGVGLGSLLVSSDGVPVVALGASTSLGNEGLSVYGLAAGVPVPTSGTP